MMEQALIITKEGLFASSVEQSEKDRLDNRNESKNEDA